MTVAIIFLVAFAWFGFHAVPSLYFGDNGELLAAVHVGGLPHPTGFPLFLLLGVLPSKANTFAVNLMSSAVGALSITLTYQLARRLFGRTSAWFAVIVIMGSCTLTLSSAMARVYSYQLACMLSVMLAAVLFKPEKRWGLLFGFLLGLSACTHILFIGGAIFSVVLLFDRRREGLTLLPWAISGIFLGASLYLWIPLRALFSPSVDWGQPTSIGMLWYYLSQRQFAEKMVSRDIVGTWLFIKVLGRDMMAEWNPLAWFMAAIGFKTAWLNQRRKLNALIALMIFNVAQLYIYGNESDLMILYRYFLPFYVCVALLAAIGADTLWNRWSGKWRESSKARVGYLLVLLLIFIVIPAWKWSGLSQADASYRFVCNLFHDLPSNATIVLTGNDPQFAFAYGRTVKGWRHDLRNLAFDLFKTEGYHEDGKCIYITRGDYPVPLAYECRPWGLAFRIFNRETGINQSPPPSPYWMPPHYSLAELHDPEALEPLANLYLQETVWKADHGDFTGALSSLGESVQVAPQSTTSLLKAAPEYEKLGDLGNCERILKKAETLQPHTFETLLDLGIYYGKTAQWELCREYLYKANNVKPNNPQVLRYIALLNQQSQGRLPQ